MEPQDNHKLTPLTVDAAGLAQMLGLSYHTVRIWISRSPERLPPRCKFAGRRALWSIDVVRQWVNDQTE